MGWQEIDDWISSPATPPDAEAVAKRLRYEQELGFPFSPQLALWIDRFGADMLGPGGLSEVDESNDPQGLLVRTTAHPEWVEMGWVPVAGDWCGNYYVVDTKLPSEPVYFIDSYEDVGVPAYVAASNFRLFVDLFSKHDRGELPFHWPFAKTDTLTLDPELELISAPMPWDA
ncbi:MAG TPA: SMI1/KNR4 family protein [Fimbriimonas sp.]|nr:SMI1/KNR4 family protein [Fimbriimonas sp.]